MLYWFWRYLHSTDVVMKWWNTNIHRHRTDRSFQNKKQYHPPSSFSYSIELYDDLNYGQHLPSLKMYKLVEMCNQSTVLSYILNIILLRFDINKTKAFSTRYQIYQIYQIPDIYQMIKYFYQFRQKTEEVLDF